MIEVNSIIDYNRTDEQLEELILFLIAVAGKQADRTARQLDKLLSERGKCTPFEFVKLFLRLPAFGSYSVLTPHGLLHRDNWMELTRTLKEYGFGCQTRLARAFTEIATSGLNLRTCSLEDLMSIHGIGSKSASCFLAWTRKGVKVAMLDTHLLKYIKAYKDAHKERLPYIGDIEIPKVTPSSKRIYDVVENFYLWHCEKKKVDPTEYDLKIWRSYANK